MEIKYRIDLHKILPVAPVVCEIGCAEGYFSQHMATHWAPKKVYMVDNWGHIEGITGDGNFPQEWHDRNYQKAMSKMELFKKITTVLRGLSHEMAIRVPDNHLDFLYLDANHSFNGVEADLKAWYPKVKIGGIIAGHDFINPAYGVRQAVEQFANRLSFKVNVISENKDEDAGFYFIKTQ